jgi:hypothetical protein
MSKGKMVAATRTVSCLQTRSPGRLSDVPEKITQGRTINDMNERGMYTMTACIVLKLIQQNALEISV